MSIREAVASDHSAIVETLVSAFYADPFLTWFIRPGARSAEGLSAFFEFMLQSQPRSNLWIDVEDEGRAVAVWVSPDAGPRPFSASGEAEKFAAGLRFAGVRRLGRAAAAETIVNRCRQDMLKRVATPRIGYLRFLACRPGDQRKGLGSALLARGLERCNEESLGAYLETATEENVAFYTKRGMSEAGRYRYARGKFVSAMLYSPRTLLPRQADITR